MITVLGVQGVPELDAAFAGLREVIRAAEIEGAIAAGELFKDAWKAEVLDHSYKTGRYYRGIQADDPVLGPGTVTVEVHSDIEPSPGQPYGYDVYQEFGTTQNPPNPTMTPAYEEHKDEAVLAIAERVGVAAETMPRRVVRPRGKLLSLTHLPSGYSEVMPK